MRIVGTVVESKGDLARARPASHEGSSIQLRGRRHRSVTGIKDCCGSGESGEHSVISSQEQVDLLVHFCMAPLATPDPCRRMLSITRVEPTKAAIATSAPSEVFPTRS